MAAAAPEPQLCDQDRHSDENNAAKIDEYEGPAPADTHNKGKLPDISQADSRTYRCEYECEPGGPGLAMFARCRQGH
jgi:hypothetical protein